MTIITITAGNKASEKHSNTPATLEAGNLFEYCISITIKLSTSRLGHLI